MKRRLIVILVSLIALLFFINNALRPELPLPDKIFIYDNGKEVKITKDNDKYYERYKCSNDRLVSFTKDMTSMITSESTSIGTWIEFVYFQNFKIYGVEYDKLLFPVNVEGPISTKFGLFLGVPDSGYKYYGPLVIITGAPFKLKKLIENLIL